MALHLVITTFNRAEYLRGLLDSVARLDPAPDGVIVVDNASTDNTAEVVAEAVQRLDVPLLHHRLSENLGGSGGFSAGVQKALDAGAEWLWLMDDDVVALPGAIGDFRPWMKRYKCIHGRRYDHLGRPFFWQHRFNSFLGVHLPVRGDVFRTSDIFLTNVGCFEGMLVHADIVREIGLPDPRFFINGDDETYGWLISRRHPVVYLNRFVLRKARPQKHIDLLIRHLNDSSDLGRYYAMRNRGLTGQYLGCHGEFKAAGFALGTAATAAKEVFRLIAVEHTLRGLPAIWRGWRDARSILADTNWEPMPPLPQDAPGCPGAADTPDGGRSAKRGRSAEDGPSADGGRSADGGPSTDGGPS